MIATKEHMPFGALVLLCIANGKDLVLGELRHGSSPGEGGRAADHQRCSLQDLFCATNAPGIHHKVGGDERQLGAVRVESLPTLPQDWYCRRPRRVPCEDL